MRGERAPQEAAQPPAWHRWLIALASVCIHLCIGSVYAFSVFVKALQRQWGWSKPTIALTFSIAIVVLGLTASFGGTWMERHGPRKSALIAAACFGIGVMGGSAGPFLGRVWLLWLSYGTIAGVGLGLGYISPVSTLVKWFPDKRGLATGMAVFGFGGSSMIAGPVQTQLIATIGVSATFLIMGGIYLCVMLASASALRFPPTGYHPAGYDPERPAAAARGFRTKAEWTMGAVVKDEKFWLFWVVFFVNISCGILLIALAAPMATETVKMTAEEAGVTVGLMGMFNGLGRLLWSGGSDFVGRGPTFMAMLVLQAGLFLTLAQVRETKWLFRACIFIILTCYGGGFSMCPAFLADMYGAKCVGSIHGVILTAWSAAGIAGPQLGAVLSEATGEYTLSLYICAAMLGAALLCMSRILQLLKRLRVVEMSTDATSDAEAPAEETSQVGDADTEVWNQGNAPAMRSPMPPAREVHLPPVEEVLGPPPATVTPVPPQQWGHAALSMSAIAELAAAREAHAG